jgi:hypothetical protein
MHPASARPGPLLRWLALAAVFFVAGAGSAAKAITADELARHLGVTYWQATVARPPGTFSVSFLEIRKGKIVPNQDGDGTYVGDKGDATGRHLVIMASHEGGRLQLTTMLGADSTTGLNSGLSNDIPMAEIVALPHTLPPGDYILGGNWNPHKIPGPGDRSLGNVQRGLLLRITAL